MDLLEVPVVRVLVSLFVGLVIGVERERHRAQDKVPSFAGMRTFGLVGLLGGLFAYSGQSWLVLLGAAFVGTGALMAYAFFHEPDRGMTTEVALLVTYALGALSAQKPELAAGLSVMVASVLGMKGSLHKLVRETLSQSELRDALTFLLLSLVVLPAAPDRPMGPYHAINPHTVALLVVLITGITGAGYIAQRLLGERAGLWIAGFAGGFVSSSATIASLASRAKEEPSAFRAAAAGAMASTVATVVEFVVLIGSVDMGLLRQLGFALGFAFVVALLVSAVLFFRAPKLQEAADTGKGRAFHLLPALLFALGISLVTLVASALTDRFGQASVLVVAAIVGIPDAQSSAASVAGLFGSHIVDATIAQLAIITALSTNTVTKIVMAFSGGMTRYAALVVVGVTAVAASAWLGIWLGRLWHI